jgi:hypothetical protein
VERLTSCNIYLREDRLARLYWWDCTIDLSEVRLAMLYPLTEGGQVDEAVWCILYLRKDRLVRLHSVP